MSDQTLTHVTLQSGHSRASPRSEVSDEIVELLRPYVAGVVEGRTMPVPGRPGFQMSGAAAEGCLLVTVWATISDTEGERAPVLTTGVGAGECAGHVWRQMHDGRTGDCRTDPAESPATPWVADRLEVGAGLHPEALQWTGDLARCLAWCWLEQ